MSFTASETDRVIACPASGALPRAESENPYSGAGDARHGFIEAVSTEGRETALAKVPDEHREECEAIDTSILPTHLAHEVAFALDMATGEARELGRGIHRDYSSVGPNEIAGTADAVGVSGDRVIVLDYKGPDPNLPSAAKSGQLRTLALMAARAYGKDDATVGFIRFLGSDVRQETADLDMFDLDAHLARLRQTRERIVDAIEAYEGNANLKPYVSEGRHCRWCSSMAYCPAKLSLAEKMERGEMVPALAPLTEETAPDAVEALLKMKQLVKRAEEHVRSHVRHNGTVVLGGGRRYGVVKSRGTERLDGDVGHAVIEETHGREVADKAVKRTITKKAIGDALNGMKGKGKEQERILDEIRARGGAKVTAGSEQVKEYTVKKEIEGGS